VSAVTTILQILGGTRFQSLCRARDFSYPANGVAFRLPQTGVNYVQIIDTGECFTMTFFVDQNEIARAEVDVHQIRPTFEQHTGIHLST
jgi:hypothetical protein